MSKYRSISFEEKIFIAGSNGMVGRAVTKKLLELGYGDATKNGKLFTPSRSKLNLLKYEEVDEWFKLHKPTIVIFAAAKVGGIYANSTKPAEFLLENLILR